MLLLQLSVAHAARGVCALESSSYMCNVLYIKPDPRPTSFTYPIHARL